MTDTNVTFLSCYNTVGHTRMYVMTLTSPPSLSLSRPWAGLSMRRFMSSHLLIQGSSLLSVLPCSLSVFWMFKNSTLSVSTSLPTITRILPGHTSHDPCLLSTLIVMIETPWLACARAQDMRTGARRAVEQTCLKRNEPARAPRFTKY
jgi:hypothetical protein